MCRSAFYKTTLACFTCRKAFKKPWVSGAVAFGDDSTEAARHRWSKCPDCAQPMADLGIDFKPPKRSDRRAWLAVRGAYRMGHQFLTCGCWGPGFIPSDRRQYRSYLADRLQHFNTRYCEALEGDGRPCAEDGIVERTSRGHDAAYWYERRELVKAELDRVGG